MKDEENGDHSKAGKEHRKGGIWRRPWELREQNIFQ